MARRMRISRSLRPPTKSSTLSFNRIVKQPVDGKVPALRVSFGGGESHILWVAAVEVSAVGAEGRDLILRTVLDH